MYLRKYQQIIIDSAKRFYTDQYSYRASALAYTSLLSVVPLLSVILFFVTLFPFASDIYYLSKNYIISNFIPVQAAAVEAYLNQFAFQATQLPWVSVIFLFVTTILLLMTIESTFNDIWKIEKRRSTLFSIILCALTFMLIPFAIGFNSSLNYFVTRYLINYTLAIKIFTFCLQIVVNVFIFTLLNVFMPNIKVHWKDAILGALVSAILFEIARRGFVFYIVKYPSYELIYGTFATIPIFLIWLYILWAITLFGALVAFASSDYRKNA